MSHKIIVCYLRANSAVLEDHILNRLAKYFAPRYAENDTLDPVVHVELYFPNHNTDNGLSAGIHYGGQMFMHPKKFSRTHWVFHSIPATAEQVKRAKQFCNLQMGSGFNYRGFFAPSMFNMSHQSRKKMLASQARMPWYCSELVAYTLFCAGILNDKQTIEARVHPNASHHVIQTCCNTFVDCARSLKGKELQL